MHRHTLMCVIRAGALWIPAGTHFLLEGRASSFPSRFHSPSSSSGVRWTLTADMSGCCSASSSLPPPSSSSSSSPASLTCSLGAIGGFFRPGKRNDIFYKWATLKTPLPQLCLSSYLYPASVSETLVLGRTSWSGWRHSAPTHTSTSHNKRGIGT